MRGIQYPIEDHFSGPWLLDQNALRALDTLVSKNWKILEQRRSQLLDLAVEIETRRYEQNTKISFDEAREKINYFRDHHPLFNVSYLNTRIHYKKYSYKYENFETAIRQGLHKDDVPEGFEIIFGSAEIEGKILLDKNKGLMIYISPDEDIQEAREFYIDLSMWAKENSQPPWQQLWGRIANRSLSFIGGLGVLLIVIGLFINILSANSATLDAQARAQELLKQGITSSNLPEAIELLLEVQVIGKTTIGFPSWYRAIFLIFLLLGIIVPIRPKVVLSIGRGTIYLKRWKVWQTVVVVTIPSLIIYNFIIPPIVNWIKLLVGGP